jgi:putative membrane protein
MPSGKRGRGGNEMRLSSRQLPSVLLAVFAVIWVALAIRPYYRQDWALENLLVAIALPLLTWSYQHWRFSNAAYLCLFIFFTLHIIGAHYTYSEVPYDQWLKALLGFSVNEALGFSRNHYDRFVHLVYGLLIALPSMELLQKRAPSKGLWIWLLPILFVSSHSVIYEMVEWAAAGIFGGDLGAAYLGTQGDVWDAQKDMFLASLGAVVGVSCWLVLRGAPAPSDAAH